jgi:hypothetical protein
MSQIYEAAKLVIAWLREEVDSSHEAMQIVKNVGEGIWKYKSEKMPMAADFKQHQEFVLARLPALANFT